MMNSTSGCLYLVPTPIGNLADITERALTILRQCDAIAAEDTRHSGQLLQHYGIHTPMFALHDHNERQRVAQVIDRLQQGESIALISDAGKIGRASCRERLYSPIGRGSTDEKAAG